MYFPDLTPYEYFKGRPPALNVGWLDPKHPFASGAVPDGFVDRLRALAKKPSEQTRGFHFCEFCDLDVHAVLHDQVAMQRLAAANAIGSAEIRVVGRDGRVYAAPTMICNYVAAHQYQPPREFVDAVMEMQA